MSRPGACGTVGNPTAEQAISWNPNDIGGAETARVHREENSMTNVMQRRSEHRSLGARAAPDRPGGVHRPDKSEHFAERRFRTIRVLQLNKETAAAVEAFPTGLAPGQARAHATPRSATTLFLSALHPPPSRGT